MRSTQLLAASVLLMFSLTSKADIIWDFFLGGTTGEITTTGNYDELVELEGRSGFLGFNLLTFQITNSTVADLPAGDIWNYSGGRVGANWDFARQMLYSVHFSGTTDITFPINVLGVDLNFTATQPLQIRQEIAIQNDDVSSLGLESCARDTEFFLNIGIPPESQTGVNCDFYRTNRFFDLAPRGPIGITSSVPEPGSLALLGLAALALIRQRKS